MPDITLCQTYPVTPDRLFQLITEKANLLQWWGHDNTVIPDQMLDFTREGPWFAVLRNVETDRVFKMSGHVTHVRPPVSVGFTWAWHDEDDVRGPDSHVTFTVSPAPEGASLTIDHRDLASDDAAGNHKQGWGLLLVRLGRVATP